LVQLHIPDAVFYLC